MAGVAQLVELWIVIPMPPSNISDLTPKTMQANAGKALECRQKWTLDLPPSAHPTLFHTQKSGNYFDYGLQKNSL
jgi:hypothetical protein